MALFVRVRSMFLKPKRRRVQRPMLEWLEGRALLAASVLPDLAMVSATTTDSQSVMYTFQVQNAAVSAPFEVAFYRAPTNQFDPTIDVKVGSQMASVSDLGIGVHTETAAISGGLPIDPSHPYLIAVANPTGAVAESDAGRDTNDFASFRMFIIGAVTHGYEIMPGLPAWVPATADTLKQDGYDATIAYDWSSISRVAAPGMAVAAGHGLADQVAAAVAQLAPQMKPGDVVDLHLIGHSRGTVVISQAGLDLEAREQSGLLPQLKAGYLKMTFLAPHPAHVIHSFGDPTQVWYSAAPGPVGQSAVGLYDQFSAQAVDPEVIVPANTADAEIYYQHTPYTQAASPSEKFFTIWDEVPVLGENGQPLLDGVAHYCDLTGIANGHYEVHDWYLQSVAPNLRTNPSFICPGTVAPPTQPPAPTPPSANGIGAETALLTPSVFRTRRSAFAFEKQVAALASSQGGGRHHGTVQSRVRSLQRFLRTAARQGDLTPAGAIFLNSELQPFLAALSSGSGTSQGGL